MSRYNCEGLTRYTDIMEMFSCSNTVHLLKSSPQKKSSNKMSQYLHLIDNIQWRHRIGGANCTYENTLQHYIFSLSVLYELPVTL